MKIFAAFIMSFTSTTQLNCYKFSKELYKMVAELNLTYNNNKPNSSKKEKMDKILSFFSALAFVLSFHKKKVSLFLEQYLE